MSCINVYLLINKSFQFHLRLLQGIEMKNYWNLRFEKFSTKFSIFSQGLCSKFRRPRENLVVSYVYLATFFNQKLSNAKEVKTFISSSSKVTQSTLFIKKPRFFPSKFHKKIVIFFLILKVVKTQTKFVHWQKI